MSRLSDFPSPAPPVPPGGAAPFLPSELVPFIVHKGPRYPGPLYHITALLFCQLFSTLGWCISPQLVCQRINHCYTQIFVIECRPCRFQTPSAIDFHGVHLPCGMWPDIRRYPCRLCRPLYILPHGLSRPVLLWISCPLEYPYPPGLLCNFSIKGRWHCYPPCFPRLRFLDRHLLPESVRPHC